MCRSGVDLHKGEYPHQQNLLDFQSVLKCVPHGIAMNFNIKY